MNTILVPFDFSERSENALHYAVGLANYLSAKIILLHVDATPLVNNEFQDLSFIISKAKEEYLQLLKDKALEIKKNNYLLGDVECISESGELKSTIDFIISDKHIDFVVMGISGHGTKIGKFILGSNAVSLSRDSVVPVFIIPKDCKFSKIKKIAYANEYDSAVKNHTGLIKIKYINSIFGSLLNVLHVIPNNHLINEQEAEIDEYVEQKLENTNHRTFILTDDNVSTAILDFIKSHEIDVIVMEQKEHSFFHKLIYPSATKEIAFGSPIPILTIQS